MKVSVVGCGAISRNHLRVLKSLKGIEISSVVDIKKDRADEIAQKVEDEAGNSGRDMQPVVHKERKPQEAALRYAGKGMDIVQAKGEDGAAHEAIEAGTQGDAQNNRSFQKYSCIS